MGMGCGEGRGAFPDLTHLLAVRDTGVRGLCVSVRQSGTELPCRSKAPAALQFL